MQKEKLIFIYPQLFTFIKTEISLLSDNYELICKTQNWTNKLLVPFNLIVQLFFLLLNLRKVNTILVSFGGYWSYLPSFLGRLFGKKVAIVVHGTDCISFSEINYGNLRLPLMRYFTQKSYQWASIILPVSESLVYTENSYFSDKILKFGYTHHLSNISTPYKVIPNGLIINDWSRNANISKEEGSFITVLTPGKIVIKGADLIVKAAKSLPNCKFYFAGIDNIEGVELTDNIICLGRLSPMELKHWYSKTQFYLQLSNTEGFGVALCEAMLCECVPIVSRVNFLPNIVGDSGFVLNNRNTSELIQIIKIANQTDLVNRMEKARARILEKFSAENRRKILIKELEKLS
jgi:glycosyltransferase involved in cell wall biosynthesis